jgi:signal transduction histidine kinase
MGPVAELLASPAYQADAQLHAELEVIHRNGLRLGKLVNTLLDFSRIQAGRIGGPLRTTRFGRVHRGTGQRVPLGHPTRRAAVGGGLGRPR